MAKPRPSSSERTPLRVNSDDRRVSFAEGVRVRLHLHKEDMSRDEVKSTWYSKTELKQNTFDAPVESFGFLGETSSYHHDDDILPGLDATSSSSFCLENLTDDIFILSPTPGDHVRKLQDCMKKLATALHSHPTPLPPPPPPPAVWLEGTPDNSRIPTSPKRRTAATTRESPTRSPKPLLSPKRSTSHTKELQEMNIAMLEAFSSSPPRNYTKRRYLRSETAYSS